MKRSLAIIGITIMLIICSTFFINKVYAAKEKPINNETESTLVELKEKERIDDLEFKGLKIIQKEGGFCFGIDAVLLSDFTKEIRNNSQVLDLGTGTGILSILLTAKTNLKKIYGIEIQEEVANMAKRSVELNQLQEKVEIINKNIKDLKNIFEKNSMDAIVTNPPYKKLDTGKTNEKENKYIARHEVTASLEDFIKISFDLLKDKGSFYMIHRPERLAEIIYTLKKNKLEPKRMRFIYSNIEQEPKLVLIKAVKNAKEFLTVEKPLFIYNKQGEYTEEILQIYHKNYMYVFIFLYLYMCFYMCTCVYMYM